MSDENSPEKSPWGWKALIISFILSVIFLIIFYLAITNEPDYMPSQQNKQTTQQHAFKNAPTMNKDEIEAAQAPTSSAEHHSMTSKQHANMSHDDSNNHGH